MGVVDESCVCIDPSFEYDLTRLSNWGIIQMKIEGSSPRDYAPDLDKD